MKRVLSALIALALTGCAATTQREKAENAAVTDVAQSLVGVASGLVVEANPLSVLIIPGKFLLLEHCKSLPQYEQPECYASVAVGSNMGVGNNWCILGALATIAVAPPFGMFLATMCPTVGVAHAMNEWSKAQDEIEFFAICREWAKEYDAEHPEGPRATCTYTPPPAEVREPVLAIDVPRISE